MRSEYWTESSESKWEKLSAFSLNTFQTRPPCRSICKKRWNMTAWRVEYRVTYGDFWRHFWMSKHSSLDFFHIYTVINVALHQMKSMWLPNMDIVCSCWLKDRKLSLGTILTPTLVTFTRCAWTQDTMDMQSCFVFFPPWMISGTCLKGI